jgi:hypothetical protein
MSFPLAKPSWYLGGRLSIKANTQPIITPTNVLNPIIRRVGIPLNRAAIVEVPDFVSEYKLSFQPPYWFVYENLRIWEYRE